MSPRVLLDRIGFDESGPEDLHPEQGEDGHEQKEEQQQRRDRLEAVGQRSHQIRQGTPVTIFGHAD